MDHHALENGSVLYLDFKKLAKVVACGEDLIPAVAQDVDTGEVLIVGYANQLALETAMEQGMATFWSSSRNELWIKGKTSGDFLELIEVRINCEQNSILYRVRLKGKGACHVKDEQGIARKGCYYRKIIGPNEISFT
jgi:phosphoribosyl-AMP cyclohydrolase